MTRQELDILRAEALDHLFTQYKKVFSASFADHTPIFRLELAHAMHSAVCRELDHQRLRASPTHAAREVVERCVERLCEYMDNEASPTRLVDESLADLRKLLEGGAA